MRKTAVITGAASGFGAALARLLGGQGWDLALVDRPGEAVGAGSQPEPIVAEFDVRDAAGWKRLQAHLQDRWPQLDLLVNAAGVGASGEVGLLPADQWRRVVDTNLIGTALGCETFLPWLRAHPERSSLVNVASVAGLISPPTMAAYAASKAGVIALSETIAAECSPGRPAVTIVCPGFFRSGLLATWHFSSEREVREAQRRMLATRLDGDALARRVRRAIDRQERYVVEGSQARWLWRLKRIAPRSTAVLLNRIYRRIR